jgi:hypothetical protein
MIKLHLPFPHTVIGYMNAGRDREFVVVERQHNIDPYVTYRLDIGTTQHGERACSHGFYTDSIEKAFANIRERGGDHELRIGNLKSYSFRDPANRCEEVFRVKHMGQLQSATFNSKGAADAFLLGLMRGTRVAA